MSWIRDMLLDKSYASDYEPLDGPSFQALGHTHTAWSLVTRVCRGQGSMLPMQEHVASSPC